MNDVLGANNVDDYNIWVDNGSVIFNMMKKSGEKVRYVSVVIKHSNHLALVVDGVVENPIILSSSTSRFNDLNKNSLIHLYSKDCDSVAIINQTTSIKCASLSNSLLNIQRGTGLNRSSQTMRLVRESECRRLFSDSGLSVVHHNGSQIIKRDGFFYDELANSVYFESLSEASKIHVEQRAKLITKISADERLFIQQKIEEVKMESDMRSRNSSSDKKSYYEIESRVESKLSSIEECKVGSDNQSVRQLVVECEEITIPSPTKDNPFDPFT